MRHGQTDWNVEQKYQGHTDILLNKNGREQAKTVAHQYLKDKEKIEVIYCSDLSRTKESAEIIASYLKLSVYCDARFREMSFGEWEGKTYDEVHQGYPEDFNNWIRDTYSVVVPGGESFSQIAERAFQGIEEISKKHQGTVLLVTHGGLIKALLYTINPENDMWKTIIEPASLSEIELKDNKYEILSVGVKVI